MHGRNHIAGAHSARTGTRTRWSLLLLLSAVRLTAAAGLADGIGDAFLGAAIIAGAASAAAFLILPSARTFLPELALARREAVH